MNTYIKLFTNDLKNKGLSLYDKAVFSSLVTKYQYHKGNEFYTYETFIADELEISESTVKRSIKTLSNKGLINITKKYHKQLQKTVNYYSIPNIDTTNTNDDRDNEIKPADVSEIHSDISMDIDTTPLEIMQENEDNEPDVASEIHADISKNNVEEIETIINSISNEETSYETGMKAIHNKITLMKQEQSNINKGIENYDIVNEVIQAEYNQSADEYFNQFNTMFDLGFTRLEHISDLTQETDNVLTPDDVLNVFKAIKQKQAA